MIGVFLSAFNKRHDDDDDNGDDYVDDNKY